MVSNLKKGIRGNVDKKISEYMAAIGSKGGKKSRRTLTPEDQKKMQAARKRNSLKRKG